MPKTLMPYPRLSYGFSLILQLNTNFYSSASDSFILCEQQVERVVFEIILEKRAEVQKVGRNVATSQLCDVRSTTMEVNKRQMSRCCNVATSARILHQTSLKSHGPEIMRGSEIRTNEGTERRAAANQIIGEDAFVFSSFMKYY